MFGCIAVKLDLTTNLRTTSLLEDKLQILISSRNKFYKQNQFFF